jgi:hypothetical protein
LAPFHTTGMKDASSEPFELVSAKFGKLKLIREIRYWLFADGTVMGLLVRRYG